MMKRKNISIIEYNFVHCNASEKNNERGVFIEESAFNALKKFVLENKQEGIEFLKLSVKKCFGEVLQAQQWVGVLETKCGTIVEILPKITETDCEKDVYKNKKLFLKMLKRLKKSPFKSINTSQFSKNKNFPLLEIFISLFCNEISRLLQRGLQSQYIRRKKNSFFLNGKFLFSQHIKKNCVHKERFFIEKDEFIINRPENKLLKSTLLYLLQKSQSQKNISCIKEYLCFFNRIDESNNFLLDFMQSKNVASARNMKEYIQPLKWAEIFLLHKHITPISGNTLSSSLLFDMNKLFEDYIGYFLKTNKLFSNVKLQIKSHHLLECPEKKFLLKPDFSFYNENKEIIADSKWKKIYKFENISQSDIYQMFGYMKKYKPQKIWLIYPKISKSSHQLENKKFYFNEEKTEKLLLKFFDMEKDEIV